MKELAERNKALVRRLYADVDAGSPTVVEDYYAHDYVDHSTSAVRAQAARPAELRERFAALRRAFPDTVHVVEDLEHGTGLLEQLGIEAPPG